MTIGLKAAVAAVFIIGFAYSFCMSIFNTYGWTKTVLLDFQNERLFINTFRYYLNRKGNVLSLLNNCSFGVYVLHFIVVGAIALMLLDAALPSIGKYVLLAISAYIASNLIVYLYLVTKETKLWRKSVLINK